LCLRCFRLREVFHKLEYMRLTVQPMNCTRGYQSVVFKVWLSLSIPCGFLKQREQGSNNTCHVIFSAFASPLFPWKHNNTILCVIVEINIAFNNTKVSSDAKEMQQFVSIVLMSSSISYCCKIFRIAVKYFVLL